jgi:hypothetical protein
MTLTPAPLPIVGEGKRERGALSSERIRGEGASFSEREKGRGGFFNADCGLTAVKFPIFNFIFPMSFHKRRMSGSRFMRYGVDQTEASMFRLT